MNSPAATVAPLVPGLDQDPGLRDDHIYPEPAPPELLIATVKYVAAQLTQTVEAYEKGRIDRTGLERVVAHAETQTHWVAGELERHGETSSESARDVLPGMVTTHRHTRLRLVKSARTTPTPVNKKTSTNPR